jgi:hypothetical protein
MFEHDANAVVHSSHLFHLILCLLVILVLRKNLSSVAYTTSRSTYRPHHLEVYDLMFICSLLVHNVQFLSLLLLLVVFRLRWDFARHVAVQDVVT